MKGSHKFIFAICLAVPFLVFYAGYWFNHSSNIKPTGFIQYDNVSYIAYAKQYLDADTVHLQYANPFNDREYQPIYFQPQTIFFAFLLKVGVPPGFILIPFTFICAIIVFWLIISIYDFLTKDFSERKLNIWLFAWGGGFLTLIGIVASSYLGLKSNFLNQMFVLDPEHGWWGLNLGRALFFTCEAYYHAIFLACIYFLLKKKWAGALILLITLLFSHPFTGIELIGIVCAWLVLETIYKRISIPWWFLVGTVCCLGVYVYYYFIYLQQFPDHQSVASQYSLNWRLRYYRMIPAYGVVGTLTIVTIYRKTIAGFFRIDYNRLFASWFIVAFLLANHEWFIKARQPVHFTRGYIWTSLFLMGLPALQHFMRFLRLRFGIKGVVIFASVFLFDNASWILVNTLSTSQTALAGYASRPQIEVLRTLNSFCDNKTLLISNDPNISYLSTLYTKAYPLVSHPYTTPFVNNKLKEYKDFMNNGVLDSSWRGRKVIFVIDESLEGAQVVSRLTGLHPTLSKQTNGYVTIEFNKLEF